jgi:sulfur-carrier protein
MSVTLRVPTILRSLTGGAAEVGVDGAATLGELIDKVDAEHPGIRGRVLDDDGKLRRFVNVYVGEDDVRFAQGLETPTPDGVTVSIIPAVAGG